MKHTELLQYLGLAKNEALLYEALLQQKEATISRLSEVTGIHRRNAHDSLSRLSEKGLALRIIKEREYLYRPVDPVKLREELSERQSELEKALPELLQSYKTDPHSEEVYLLRGLEGWKNYMRQILATGEDVYCLGGKGQWREDVIGPFFGDFVRQAKKLGLNFNMIYDADVPKSVGKALDARSRHLPKHMSTDSAVIVFGDRTVFIPRPRESRGRQFDSLTMIVNPAVAETFRTWWKLMWNQAKDYS